MLLLLFACTTPEPPTAPEARPAPPAAAPLADPGPTAGGGQPGTPAVSELPPAKDPRPTGAAACATPAEPARLAPAEADVFSGWLDTMGKRYTRRPLVQELTVEWIDREPLDAAALEALVPDADPVAYDDARARSATVGNVLELEPRALGWTFLQEFERKQLFAGGGWAAFQQKHPDAGGLLALTRAGFDSGCTTVVFGYYLSMGEGQGGSWLVWGKREGEGWLLGGETRRSGGLR